jgi:hypothetical protein
VSVAAATLSILDADLSIFDEKEAALRKKW